MQIPVHTRCVRRLFFHDGIKTLLALFGAMAAALLCLPISYRLAMALVEITAGKQTNRILSALSDFCQKATLLDVFRLNFFLFFAVACLFLFARLRKSLGLLSVEKRPWALFIPAHDCGDDRRSNLKKNSSALFHGVAGFLLASILLCSIAWYFYRDSLLEQSFSRPLLLLIVKICWVLIAAAVIEIILRGVLLGIWLRNTSPLIAIILVSLIGSAGCFLQSPPSWVDPQEVHVGTGFSVVKAMFLYGLTEKILWVNFVPIFAMGIVVGLARFRSSSLWLPLGLHLGVSMCGVLWSQRVTELTLPLPMQVGISSVIAAIIAGMVVIILTKANKTP